MTKCLVKTCQNKSEDGKFEGPLCQPCADALRGYPSEYSAQRIRESLPHSPVNNPRYEFVGCPWDSNDDCWEGGVCIGVGGPRQACGAVYKLKKEPVERDPGGVISEGTEAK